MKKALALAAAALVACGAGDEADYLADVRAISHPIAQLNDDLLLDIGQDLCEMDGPEAIGFLTRTLDLYVESESEAEAWMDAADRLC